MNREESELAEALARLVPDLDAEAQIVVTFANGFRGGIVVKVDGVEQVTVPWTVVAELVVSRMRL